MLILYIIFILIRVLSNQEYLLFPTYLPSIIFSTPNHFPLKIIFFQRVFSLPRISFIEYFPVSNVPVCEEFFPCRDYHVSSIFICKLCFSKVFYHKIIYSSRLFFPSVNYFPRKIISPCANYPNQNKNMFSFMNITHFNVFFPPS